MLAHNDIMQLSAVAARATAFGDAAPAADVFIEDEHQPGRVKRVNDNNIDSSSQMMPAEF